MMPKPPKEFCIDSFTYKKYIGDNNWSEPQYDTEQTITNCRVDRGAEYTTVATGKQLLYNAVIFCYEGITNPLPEFVTQSVVKFDDKEHVITKVIPVYEAYKKTIYSYELEVV